ncbi:MAG TPA: hypothetical protein VN873_05020 [Candidatus Angelobacter sp.]|nr:hypothetical protein [Candidatus Angelobacter sp.]
MNPIKQIEALTHQAMAQSGQNFNTSYALTLKAHPLMAVLMRAYGASPERVQFANARILKRLANPNPVASRQAFQEQVRAEMERTGLPYDRVFNLVSKKRADFANSEDLRTVQTAAAGSGGVPELTPGVAKIFRLPNDVTPEEWRKIWEANGGSATTINYGKCFSAACDLTQLQKGGNIDDALQAAKARFVDLWAATAELAKLAF